MRKRQLLCPDCADKYEHTEEDIERGWLMRRVKIGTTVRPPVHTITINTTRGKHLTTEVDVPVRCDLCNDPLEGKPSMAITEWMGCEETPAWEWEFGGPVPTPLGSGKPLPNYDADKLRRKFQELQEDDD